MAKVKNWIRYDKMNKHGHVDSVVHTEDMLRMQWVNLGDVLDTAQGEEVAVTFAEEGGAADAFIGHMDINYGYLDYDDAFALVEAGEPTRAVHPTKGDIISINIELANGAVKGDELAIGPDGLGVKKASGEDVVIGRAIDTNYKEFVGELLVIRLA